MFAEIRGLTVVLDKVWLKVPKIQMTSSSRHEELNDALRFGWMMRGVKDAARGGCLRPFSRQHRGERNAPKTTTRVAEERASGNWRRAFDSLLFHDRLRCWGKQDVVAATAAAANAFTSEGGFAAEVHVVGHAFGERIAVWNHDLLGKVAALERLNIGAVGQSQTGKGQ